MPPQSERSIEKTPFGLLAYGKSAVDSRELLDDILALASHSGKTIGIRGFFASAKGQSSDSALEGDEILLYVAGLSTGMNFTLDTIYHLIEHLWT